MSRRQLGIYLRDHLSGAQAALEIADHIESSHGDTEAGYIVRELREEIVEDRRELELLLERIDHSSTVPRRMFGWLAEKVVELKLEVDDPSDGHLRLLESIELLSLGVEGKLLLWRALDQCKATTPELSSPDYTRLMDRARAQREMLEPVRLLAAQRAVQMDENASEGWGVGN